MPPLFIIVIIVAICYMLFSLYYIPIRTQLNRITLINSSAPTSLYNEITSGSVIIRAFGCEDYYFGKIKQSIDINNQLNHFIQCISLARSQIFEIITGTLFIKKFMYYYICIWFISFFIL